MNLILTFTFVFVASALAVVIASVLLLFREAARQRVVALLVGYACGILLGAAFFGLLPAALRQGNSREILATVLLGIIIFFVVERFLHWHHCHKPGCDAHLAVGTLILLGDGIHNFIDGVLIASAFQVSIELGIATSLAVLTHEVPQEVGDFAILISAGYSPRRAFRLNLYSALSAMLGAGVALLVPLGQMGLIPHVIALAVGSFLYIAVSDLIPDLHRQQGTGEGSRQLILMFLGIFTMWGLPQLLS